MSGNYAKPEGYQNKFNDALFHFVKSQQDPVNSVRSMDLNLSRKTSRKKYFNL